MDRGTELAPAGGKVNGHGQLAETKVVEPTKTEEEKKQERKGVIVQVIMGICANISILGPAMGFGYSAVALGPLMSKSSDIRIDGAQANWIATAAALGTPVGCLLCSFVMKRGRKISLLCISLLSIIGWLTIYWSQSYEHILVGRVISGVATGMASVPATVYVAEVASPAWRSTMVTWTSVAIAIGVLIVYIFGYILKENWRLVSLMCAIFPIISVILTVAVIPESPIWLRDQGRLDEALDVLKRFRGIPKHQVAPPELLVELCPPQRKKKQNLMRHLIRRNSLVPFAVMVGYFFFQQFSGIFVVIYYAVDIILEAGITIDPYLGAVLIGVTRLAGSILVASVSRRFGRRLPSIISGTGMTVFMGGLAVFLFLTDQGYIEGDSSGLVPVVCILMYIFLSTVGFLVIPFAMVGEVYPTKVKDILSGLTTCIGYIFSSITVKTYPDMLALMGKHGVFFFYAVVSLVGAIFIALFLPETKGKTLHEIEEMFRKKKRRLEEYHENERIVSLRDLSAVV